MSTVRGHLQAQSVQVPLPSIDELMERSSEALAACEYFEAERLALEGLRRTVAERDYERAGRITMPLLEARRQKMQLAQDVNRVVVVGPGGPGKAGLTEAGMYLVQPPAIAADGRAWRMDADVRHVPVIVLAREPMSRSGARTGLWPVVAVGPSQMGRDLSVRTYVKPPACVQPAETGMTRDVISGEIDVAWFLEACEALGDAAIAKLKAEDPAAHRVEDLVEFIEAWPTHEKLHQRLMMECRQAHVEPTPTTERRRGIAENPWSF